MTEAVGNTRRRRRLVVAARATLVLAAVLIVLRLTGCMERMFYYPVAEPTPVPADSPATEPVWFESSDGTRLHGWYTPATGPGPAAGTILHVHGNAGNVTSHAWFSAHLPPAGFNLLLFDYRGYGQSHGTARRRAALIADTHAALDHLLGRDDVDPDRLGIFGHSLGAGMALNVMAERPEVRAAVITSGFTSWREIAANAVSGDPPGPIGRGLAWLLIGDSHRPVDAIARIDRPVLVLHGSDDSIIPVSHARRLAEAGPAATLRILEGGDHNTLRETHPEIDGLMIDFFRKHLGDG